MDVQFIFFLSFFIMQLYSKEYLSDAEEFQRRGIWEMHWSYVEEHNRNADVYGYTTAMNEYADLVRKGRAKFRVGES